MLDEGTLYVAKFNADGGEWLKLEHGQNGLTDANGFTSQADVLFNTRLAADFVGATKMDRPEWGTVSPFNGEIYFTPSNNSNRTAEQVNDANPRGPNPYGQIIKIVETGNNPVANTFVWDLFLLAGTLADRQDPNGAPLTADNTFASPDGLWMDGGCEVTGVIMTPDRKTMFVNLQHPGEQGTVVITRDDDGVIGV